MTAMGIVLQRSAWLAWALLVLSAIGAASLVLDNTVPWSLIEYRVGPVAPGGVLRVEAIVQRDVSRKCSVQLSRHVFDATGARRDVVPAMLMTAAALEVLEKTTPGRLVFEVAIPEFSLHLPGAARRYN